MPLQAAASAMMTIVRRWGAAAVAVLVVGLGTTACGRGQAKASGPQSYGDPSMVGGVGGSGKANGTSTTAAAATGGGSGGRSAGSGNSAPLTTPPKSGSGTAGASPPPPAGPSGGSSASTQSQIAAAGAAPVGSFARTLLQPQPATSTLIEIMEQTGAAPRPATTQHLVSVLANASGKQIAVQTTPLSGSAQSWSDDDLRSTADQHTRFHQGAGGVAVLHLLYVHGDYHGDQSVLGVADRGDTVAIFVDQLESASTVAVPESVLEDAVTIHETGHVLGLVDLVLHTGRQDPQHPGHSPNKGSVMYWAVDTDLVSQIVQGGPSTNFDDADRQDLTTIRNGA